MRKISDIYSCKHYLYKNIYNTVLNMNIVRQELEYLHRNKYSKVFTCIVLIHTNTKLHHITTKKSVFITTKRCFYVKISIKLYKEEQIRCFFYEEVLQIILTCLFLAVQDCCT